MWDVPVDEITPVDATGAGDQFAAGFLYGLVTKQPIEICCKMGCIAAGEVIRHIARPETSVRGLFKAAALLCLLQISQEGGMQVVQMDFAPGLAFLGSFNR